MRCWPARGVADPVVQLAAWSRAAQHVVGRDVAGRLELQRLEERVREGRGLLVADAERDVAAWARGGRRQERGEQVSSTSRRMEG